MPTVVLGHQKTLRLVFSIERACEDGGMNRENDLVELQEEPIA